MGLDVLGRAAGEKALGSISSAASRIGNELAHILVVPVGTEGDLASRLSDLRFSAEPGSNRVQLSKLSIVDEHGKVTPAVEVVGRILGDGNKVQGGAGELQIPDTMGGTGLTLWPRISRHQRTISLSQTFVDPAELAGEGNVSMRVSKLFDGTLNYTDEQSSPEHLPLHRIGIYASGLHSLDDALGIHSIDNSDMGAGRRFANMFANPRSLFGKEESSFEDVLPPDRSAVIGKAELFYTLAYRASRGLELGRLSQLGSASLQNHLLSRQVELAVMQQGRGFVTDNIVGVMRELREELARTGVRVQIEKEEGLDFNRLRLSTYIQEPTSTVGIFAMRNPALSVFDGPERIALGHGIATYAETRAALREAAASPAAIANIAERMPPSDILAIRAYMNLFPTVDAALKGIREAASQTVLIDAAGFNPAVPRLQSSSINALHAISSYSLGRAEKLASTPFEIAPLAVRFAPTVHAATVEQITEMIRSSYASETSVQAAEAAVRKLGFDAASQR